MFIAKPTTKFGIIFKVQENNILLFNMIIIILITVIAS